MKIFHCADIHLGRQRLDGRLPDSDIAEAFGFIADRAIEEGADVFLIAGDLFDRPQVEPPNLWQAMEVLRRLKDAGIPVVAIEGNHDKAFLHSDSPTWVRHLAEEGLLVLLKPEFSPEGAVLDPWDPESRRGAWIEIGGVRFTGAGYLGAATPSKVRQIVAALEPGRVHVLLLHAGPEYFVGEGGGFTRDDLKGMEEKVCYLALGHIHKPMRYGDWACNPGSPENCDLREAGYGTASDGTDTGRGFAVVEIDPDRPAAPVSLEIRSNPRRPCLRLDLDCTPFGNKIKHGVDALVGAAVEAITEKCATGFQPVSGGAETTTPEDINQDACSTLVVEVRLTGRLNLKRVALDQLAAADEIRKKAGVFAVVVDPSGLNIADAVFPPGMEGAGGGISRAEVEKRALRTLIDDEPLWQLDGERDAFAGLFLDLKDAVQRGVGEDVLAERIAASPLIRSVRDAKAAAQAASAADDVTTAAGEEGNA